MPSEYPKQAFHTTLSSIDDWHAHLGHPHNCIVSQIINNYNISVSSSNKSPCSSCILGKFAKLPFAAVEHTSNAPFQIIHSDVWGPSPILSFHGYRYFIVFIDDFTRFSWIYFLKNKSDVYSTFLNFESYVHRQFNSKILAFHSDWGGEFQKLHSYFNKNGIIHRISCPYTHE